MRRRLSFIVFIFMAVLFLSVVNKSFGSGFFSDVKKSDWFYNFVLEIYNDNITTGYPDGTYKPYSLVTRAQMAAFLARALKLNTPDRCTNPPFSDVPVTNSYCPYIEALKNIGITHGVGNGYYDPEGYVTRAEIATFIVRALHLNTQPCTSRPFVDVPTDAWYCPFVQALKNAGMVSGYLDGTYRPDSGVTRAEMAAFLAKAFVENDNSSAITQLKQESQIKGATVDLDNSMKILTDSLKLNMILPTYILSFFSNRSINTDLPNNAFFYEDNSSLISIMRSALAVPIGFLKLYRETRAPINNYVSCSGGGSYTYQGDYNADKNDYNMSLDFDHCITSGGIEINGSMNVSGVLSSNNFDFVVTTPQLTMNRYNGYYTIGIDNFAVSTKGSYNSSNHSLNMQFIVNGKLLLDNNTDINDNYSISFTAAKIYYDSDSNEAKTSFDGVFSENWYNEKSIKISANNFALDVDNLLGDEQYISINGILGLHYTPNDFCYNGDGVYKITTITPLHKSKNDSTTNSGAIKINDNATIEWNNDGTITVMLNDDVIYHGDEDTFFESPECLIPSISE